MEQNKRYLALDVGFKRIGVALSLSGVISEPLTIINRKTNKETFSEIEKLITKYGVTSVVIGLPISQEGKKTKIAEKIEKFTKKLMNYIENKGIGVEVIFEDESLTSLESEALETLKRRDFKDDVAAALILKSFLERKKK